METTPLAHVDELDPFVAVLTWGLTQAAAHFAVPDRFRAIIPLLAVLIATALVAGLQATEGEPLTAATVVRGFGAGAAAIAGHSGLREATKFLSSGAPIGEEKEE